MIRKLQHFVREKLMELKQFDREHPEDRESSFEINEEEDS